MTRTTWLRSLALALIVSSSTVARAQSSDEDPKALARRAFAEGEQSYVAGDYGSALAAFRRAYALAHHDNVRFNIAACLTKLGRFREAAREYDALAESIMLDQAAAARARDAASNARAQLGTLVVNGSPAGAEMIVDGEPTCQIPCRVDLDPQDHGVVVRSGTREVMQRVRLEPGRVSAISISLDTPAPAPPTPAAPVAPPARTRPATRAEPASAVGVGPVTWIGVGLVVVGAAGTTYFGLRAQKLHDEHVAEPTEERREDGIQAKNFANASLAVGIVGALAIGLDLLVLSNGKKTEAGLPSRFAGSLIRGYRF